MTELTQSRSLWSVIVTEPLDLVKAQPHQILLSTGSVAIMGQFAGSGGIVHPFVGYCIAVGVEWAYLRGLASDSKAPTIWGAILNWSAFVIVVLWGVLWVAQVSHVIGADADGLVGWLLASAHIVPIAWLSLCSAMTHQAAAAQEARTTTQMRARATERAEEVQAERRAFDLAQAEEDAKLRRLQIEEDAKLERWKQAQRTKAELKSVTETSVTTLSQGVTPPNRDTHRKAVVTHIMTHGAALNVTHAAREIGISRPMFYKLRDEAIAAGEMEA